MSLPWKSDFLNSVELPDNYELCVRRLNSLKCRLDANPELLHQYDAIFNDQFDNSIIEKVPLSEYNVINKHFLAHHEVVCSDKETKKSRIVFDGSAKESKVNPSLKDLLEVEDNYMPSLFDTIIRFCCHSIWLTADIEKAFLQIAIADNDRILLRFLWFDNVKDKNASVVQYRWAGLPFSLTSSPSILGATLR